MTRQPQRSRRVREERRFDKTQLKSTGHGRIVNRDYISHALRWGWVSRQVKQGESILDVGCGQETPLLYILANRIQTVPDVYVGVDLNNIPRKSNCKWADIFDHFNFVDDAQKLMERYTPFDKAVCFEVIEHAMPEDGKKLLQQIFSCLRPKGVLYLSTPVFDGYRAANHLHEYTIPELQSLIEEVGFKIVRRIGTFASKPDIKRVLDDNERKVYEKLEWWFGGDVMSTIFAANYPDASRNNVWICQKPAE